MVDSQANWGGDASDDHLVARVRAGESSCYEILVARYSGRMRRAARRVLPNQADVDEVVQEAHFRAFCCIHQFAGRSSISSWLTQIAIHVALARRRQKWFGLESSQVSCGFDPLVGIHSLQRNPEQQLRSKEMMETIEAAVWALPHHYRTVFVLRSVQELSTAEVAVMLRISEPCARTRLHRAKGLLGSKLSEQWNRAGATAAEPVGPA
ncbi:MAG: sigma-70 family RNA polymerase sigma factor [Bryobacterales bacterium]|nr:sigma-70 family RNA polymerase sigma factor [Bryobacterales bacterium]